MTKINDKMFRIITEAKNVQWLKDRASSFFGICTFIETEEIWSGRKEKSIIIEVLATAEEWVKTFAREICRYNEQTTVLLQEIPCVYQFISLHDEEK